MSDLGFRLCSMSVNCMVIWVTMFDVGANVFKASNSLWMMAVITIVGVDVDDSIVASVFRWVVVFGEATGWFSRALLEMRFVVVTACSWVRVCRGVCVYVSVSDSMVACVCSVFCIIGLLVVVLLCTSSSGNSVLDS